MGNDSLGTAVVGDVRWRVVPLLILCLFIAFPDRVNVGFGVVVFAFLTTTERRTSGASLLTDRRLATGSGL